MSQAKYFASTRFDFHAVHQLIFAAFLFAPASLWAQSGEVQPVASQPDGWRVDFGEVNNSVARPASTTNGDAAPNFVGQQPAATLANPVAGGASSSAASTTTQGVTNSSQSLQSVPVGEQTPQSDQSITPISHTMGRLPNEAGQVWREYDISKYTSRIRNTTEPEKAIIDWILLETGHEMWFRQPLGILNASREKLYVYHTPEIHKVIQPLVDRFVYHRGEAHSLEVNLVTVTKPNWRSEHYSVLQPVEIPSPGVEAWMVSKENAALLLGELARRSDFQKHAGGVVAIQDGQKLTFEKRTPRQFVRSVRWVPEQVPNYQPLLTHVDEGYSLNISCLKSIDGKNMEACVGCQVDQIEKLNQVKINVPAIVGGAQQKMSLQIPQIVSWRLQERIRWPADQVLLLNVGVVANPSPGTDRPLANLVGGSNQRADALLFLEYEGPVENSSLQQANRAGNTPLTRVGHRR